jgi:hypothetical protein
MSFNGSLIKQVAESDLPEGRNGPKGMKFYYLQVVKVHIPFISMAVVFFNIVVAFNLTILTLSGFPKSNSAMAFSFLRNYSTRFICGLFLQINFI